MFHTFFVVIYLSFFEIFTDPSDSFKYHFDQQNHCAEPSKFEILARCKYFLQYWFKCYSF